MRILKNIILCFILIKSASLQAMTESNDQQDSSGFYEVVNAIKNNNSTQFDYFFKSSYLNRLFDSKSLLEVEKDNCKATTLLHLACQRRTIDDKIFEKLLESSHVNSPLLFYRFNSLKYRFLTPIMLAILAKNETAIKKLSEKVPLNQVILHPSQKVLMSPLELACYELEKILYKSYLNNTAAIEDRKQLKRIVALLKKPSQTSYGSHSFITPLIPRAYFGKKGFIVMNPVRSVGPLRKNINDLQRSFFAPALKEKIEKLKQFALTQPLEPIKVGLYDGQWVMHSSELANYNSEFPLLSELIKRPGFDVSKFVFAQQVKFSTEYDIDYEYVGDSLFKITYI